ncbi:MAG: hypothetical protein IJO63_05635 [Bacilli bacterium]|nr:hypothetical protein [Bacilli bacterium]
MQYDWYNTQIKQRLRELKSLRDIDDSKEIRIAISACEAQLGYRKPHSKKEPSARDLYLSEYLEFKKYNMIWPDLKKFASLGSKGITFDVEKSKIALEPSQMFEMTHDFFRDATPQKTFEDFLHFYKNRRKDVHFITNSPESLYAESFYLPYYREHFIQMIPRNEFGDLSTLSHEYGHGIQFLNNYCQKWFSRNSLFIEIISTFYEFLTLIHYSHNGEYQEAATMALLDNWEEMKYAAGNINTFLTYTDLMGLNECANKYELVKEIDSFIKEFGPTNIAEISKEDGLISDNIIYVFAASIVCQLLNIYYEDPDKAFYYANKLMMIRPTLSPEEFYEEILNVGIFPNDGFIQFEEHMKRELTRFS